MTGRPAEPDVTTLHQFVSVLRRHWLLVLGVVLVCIAVPILLSLLATPKYEASSRVLFGGGSLSDTALEVERDSSDPERAAATAQLLASSEAIADRVRRRLGLRQSVSSLLDQVDVEAEANANVLRFVVSDEQPRRAATIANAFGEEFIAFRAEDDSRSVQTAENALRSQLEGLDPASPEAVALQQSLQRVAALKAAATGDARLIANATVPTEPASLGALRSGIIGAIVGLALGLSLAFLLEALDRRLKSLEDFERAYRLRVLTLVPRRHFRQSAAEARTDELEPFRILRNALEYTAVASDVNVLVTSAAPGEGKTTVAVDLAHAFALTGRRVILIELDLRRPTFAQHFNLRGRHGVTTVLAGRSPASELLQQPLPSVPDLWVLPAGPLPPNPAELLDSPYLNAMLEELADDDVTLVLDAPPLVPVVDTQVLLRQSQVDTAVIVGRMGVTTRDQVRQARGILEFHRFEPLGLVVTGHTEPNRYGYEAYTSGTPAAAAPPEPDPAPRSQRALRG